MRELQVFTVDFKLLFMPLPTQMAKAGGAAQMHQMTIAIGPQNFERISQIISRCESLGADKEQQTLAQQLQRAVNALDKVYN